MKKIILLLVATMLFTACSNDDDFGGSSGLTTIEFNVFTNYDEDAFEGLAAENVEVTLSNTNTGDEYVSTSKQFLLKYYQELIM